jgi:DnaJ-class molecular chaperone
MIKCPACNGMGSEVPDPANYCGYCECEQVVSLWKYIYWKFCEKFLWK